MAWTPETERRRRGRDAGEAGSGAARSYSANQVALDPIKLQKNEVINPTKLLRGAVFGGIYDFILLQLGRTKRNLIV